MRWIYHLDKEDRDQQGHWHPRLVWEDGTVSPSAGRICGGESYEQAAAHLRTWNARSGLDETQQEDVVHAAMQRNPNFTPPER